MEVEHGADGAGHGAPGGLGDAGRVALALALPFGDGPALRQIAVGGVVGGGLVGDAIGADAAADELGEDVGGVAEQGDRDWAGGVLDDVQGLVEVACAWRST